MTTIRIWSGREIRALREARRMSQRDFAAHLGISERMVAKWEAGGEKINPRPVNQSALDSSLDTAPPDVQARFEGLLNFAGHAGAESASDDSNSGGSPLAITGHQVRHPIDGKLMALVQAGEFLHGESNEPIFVPSFYIDVFPTTNDASMFVKAFFDRDVRAA